MGCAKPDLNFIDRRIELFLVDIFRGWLGVIYRINLDCKRYHKSQIYDLKGKAK